MPETFSFFADLSIVIAVAATVGVLFSRFNLPLTVGYILAGLIVGPHMGPALIKNSASIQMLSDFGVMFLMFSIGLGFSFRRVRQMGGRVVFPAVWDILFMVVGGFLIGKLMGWGNLECFLLGLILCDSSTSIAAKTLEGLGWLNKRFADSTFAIALIEDVLAILLIAVLNGISGGGAAGETGASLWDTAAVIGKQMGMLALFLVGVTVFGILLVPRLMNFVSKRFGDEIVLMTALGLCFGISCLAQEGLGLSLVVGAFLAGAVVAEAQARRRIERIVRPVTDLFSSVFFVSVGLMINPTILFANIGTILFVTLAMIMLKLANGFISNLLVGEHPRDAFKVGIGLGQVAEFSFIIAGIAMTGNMSERPLYQIAVGVALLCTATNPYLLRYSDKLYAWCSRFAGVRLRAVVHAYRSASSEMATSKDEDGRSTLAAIRAYLIQIVVSLALCLILFGAVYFVTQIPTVEHFLQRLDTFWQPTRLRIPWSGILCCAGALLVASPAFWTTMHLWRELTKYISENTLQAYAQQFPHIRNFVRLLLTLTGWAGILIYAILLCSTFISNIWVLAVVIYGVSLVMMCSSKRLKHNYKVTHAEIVRAFDVGALPKEDPINIGEVLAVHTDTIVVPRFAYAEKKTLGELNLRGETGAAVISVTIPGQPLIVSPGRDTRLYAGASLVVVGSDQEIARAAELLTRPAPDEEA